MEFKEKTSLSLLQQFLHGKVYNDICVVYVHNARNQKQLSTNKPQVEYFNVISGKKNKILNLKQHAIGKHHQKKPLYSPLSFTMYSKFDFTEQRARKSCFSEMETQIQINKSVQASMTSNTENSSKVLRVQNLGFF